jgi:hypothetical protein
MPPAASDHISNESLKVVYLLILHVHESEDL